MKKSFLFLGHIMRGEWYQISRLIIEGTIEDQSIVARILDWSINVDDLDERLKKC